MNVLILVQSYEKSRVKQRKYFLFLPRQSKFAILLMAKLQKKVVKNNGFWKINAIRPEIKARRGRTRKFILGQKAKWGGLVKELGCQIVTLKTSLLGGLSFLY